MIITISGAAGSGKSTIAQRLSEELSWPRYYIGGIRREMAKKRGMTLADYNKLGETDFSTDKELDDYQKNLGLKEDNFIIEGRTSWYFIPHSLKIYLDVSLEEGAKRIFLSLQKSNERNEGNDLKDLEAVKKSVIERSNSDKLRYQKYYNIDVNDVKHYDFYLDTSKFNQEEVFTSVFNFVKSRLSRPNRNVLPRAK